MGVGLSLGINDFSLLKKSIKNLGVAVGIGLIVSALYFAISPISTPSNELFARTNPTLLDVVVAFFGGLAGILAGSRKEKSNVIPGVAIATALMPPLCTAGFGLAHGQWSYFFGALYLFLINSVLIAAATTIVVRYLRFPMVSLNGPRSREENEADVFYCLNCGDRSFHLDLLPHRDQYAWHKRRCTTLWRKRSFTPELRWLKKKSPLPVAYPK